MVELDGHRVAGLPGVFKPSVWYPRLDDDGNDAGAGYSVYIGTGMQREQQIAVMGSKEEVLALLKSLLGGGAPAS